MSVEKMSLQNTAIAEALKAHDASVDDFLDPERQLPNVVGMGIGVKVSKGKFTGEPALVVLVTRKVEADQLREEDKIPAKLAEMQTDVLTVGYLFAGGTETLEAGSQTLARRVRPAQGGYSVGHKNITAGTIATCVYDILPIGTTDCSNVCVALAAGKPREWTIDSSLLAARPPHSKCGLFYLSLFNNTL